MHATFLWKMQIRRNVINGWNSEPTCRWFYNNWVFTDIFYHLTIGSKTSKIHFGVTFRLLINKMTEIKWQNFCCVCYWYSFVHSWFTSGLVDILRSLLSEKDGWLSVLWAFCIEATTFLVLQSQVVLGFLNLWEDLQLFQSLCLLNRLCGLNFWPLALTCCSLHRSWVFISAQVTRCYQFESAVPA